VTGQQPSGFRDKIPNDKRPPLPEHAAHAAATSGVCRWPDLAHAGLAPDHPDGPHPYWPRPRSPLPVSLLPASPLLTRPCPISPLLASPTPALAGFALSDRAPADPALPHLASDRPAGPCQRPPCRPPCRYGLNTPIQTDKPDRRRGRRRYGLQQWRRAP
jgi:hypothetical protein